MNKEWIELYRKEIKEFGEETREFHDKEMNRKDYKHVSGGMGSYAQRDADQHMVRFRMNGGNLTKAKLKHLVDTIDKYDVKRLKLSTCQTIQLHDLKYDQVAPIIEEAIDAKIYTKAGGGDNPRNVMTSPLAGLQKGEPFDVMPYATAAADYMLSICRDFKMPRKLKVAFCNGVDDSVHTTFRDMGFVANPDGTFKLYVAGGLGANHKMGVLVKEDVPAKDIFYYIKAMIDLFCANGNYENRAKARTRYLQETMGAELLKEELLRRAGELAAQGGHDCIVQSDEPKKRGTKTIEGPRIIEQKQEGLYAVEYHPIGGELPVDMPKKMLDALSRMDEVECRIGPDETMYFVNCTADEAQEFLDMTNDAASTPFEHSVACIGASICQQGLRNSQAVLRDCIEELKKHPQAAAVLPKVRISGCTSSCSAHQIGAIGFQGFVKVVDKVPQPAYRVFVGGSDKSDHVTFGDFVDVVLEKDMPALFVKLGEACAAAGKDWDSYAQDNREEIVEIIKSFV